jgi:hypothetical protein
MVYLYDACDQISDFCHQQLLRKMRRKLSWTDEGRMGGRMEGRTDGQMDRGKTVYPPPPLGSGGIISLIGLPTKCHCSAHKMSFYCSQNVIGLLTKYHSLDCPQNVIAVLTKCHSTAHKM